MRVDVWDSDRCSAAGDCGPGQSVGRSVCTGSRPVPVLVPVAVSGGRSSAARPSPQQPPESRTACPELRLTARPPALTRPASHPLSPLTHPAHSPIRSLTHPAHSPIRSLPLNQPIPLTPSHSSRSLPLTHSSRSLLLSYTHPAHSLSYTHPRPLRLHPIPLTSHLLALLTHSFFVRVPLTLVL